MGFTTYTDRQRLKALIKRGVRTGLCSTNVPAAADLVDSSDDALLKRIVNNPHHVLHQCASGCVLECRICNREVAGSNLGRGCFAPRSTQPSIPPGSVNEYQQRRGRQRQVWLILIADVQVRL